MTIITGLWRAIKKALSEVVPTLLTSPTVCPNKIVPV